MDKKNENGSGKNMDPFKGQEIEFPVTFELKAVMVQMEDSDENKKKLDAVFSKQKIANQFVADKVSSKGSYISYTYNVTLSSKEQMERMYDALKKVEGLKFAL